MDENKTSLFNQKFDARTFLIIFKKNVWVVILLILISLGAGFAYHRYSTPRYKTSTIIQVKNENKTNQILGISSNLMEKDLAPVIELIRSNEFLKTVVEVLPLDISYYRKGTFLSTELYGSTPFEIKYNIINTEIYDQNIDLEFKDYKCHIAYTLGNQKYEYTIQPEELQTIYGMDIYVHFPSKKDLEQELDPQNKSQYFFTINNPNTTLKNLSKRLNVQILNETAGTIKITYQDFNARKSTEITNTIAEKFIEFDEAKKKESATNIIKYIDQQMENVFTQLNATEKDLHNFREQNNILNIKDEYLFNKSNIYSSQISDIESKILNVDFEIMTLEKMLDKLKSNPEINTYELLAMLSGQKSEVFLSSMINSLQELLNRKEVLLFDLTSNSHKIQTLDEQIKSKKETIIDFTRSTIKRLNAEKVELDKKNKELENIAFKESKYDEIEYARLQRLYAINEDFYAQLIKSKAETLISQAGYVSNNIILEKANIPSSPDFPIFSTIMTIAFIISLILSFIYLAIKYLLYNKIISIDDIINHTNIPVVGGISLSKTNSEISQMVVHLRPKSMLSEAFRNIRTNLEFYPIKDKSRIITVSSTIAGEGKTFLALNIGAIYAMSGKKVIILDFDLRKPRINECFNVDNIKGVTSILLGKNSFQECVRNSSLEGLDFITSGPLPPNPGEFILTNKYNELIEQIKQYYDIIIIDTPPIGIVNDALASYRLADNQLYVMRAGYSPRAFVNNLNYFSKSSQLKNLAIVLNGIEKSIASYGYGYKAGYGYTKRSAYYGISYLNDTHNSYYGEEDKAKSNFFNKIRKKFKK
ncbi:MAG: Tyrosine-protein kinase YwqD [Bacteroidetes bacterium ADurb.Bin028]|nr:MAG: Tyrosine-protein kinase YwqD [Bacteroidetes bacterium ADurb.Bin028]